MNKLGHKSSQGAVAALGIDIGSRLTKALAMEGVAERVDIRAAAAFELPSLLSENGIITNPRSFGRTLSRQLEAHGFPRSPVVFSIPSNLATLRWINLPELEGDDLKDAARFKVKRHLPFPVEDAYIEASIPDIVAGETTGASLVIAVRKEVVESRAEALTWAGLELMRAELEAQAILRIVERRLNTRSVLWRDASLTIIDLGGTNTHMYVVQNQRLQFIRGVRFGATMFSEAVAQKLGMSVAEAAVLLGNPLTVLDEHGVVHMRWKDQDTEIDLSTGLEKLSREFVRLLRYFRSLHPERSYAGILDHLIVCGGLVALQGFAEYLERHLGLRVERAKPIAGMAAMFNRDTFQSISQRQESFTVVVGLGLSGLDQQLGNKETKNAGQQFTWTRAA